MHYNFPGNIVDTPIQVRFVSVSTLRELAGDVVRRAVGREEIG